MRRIPFNGTLLKASQVLGKTYQSQDAAPIPEKQDVSHNINHPSQRPPQLAHMTT
jgi:hypothetical protein